MLRGLTRARCLPRWLDEAAAAGGGRYVLVPEQVGRAPAMLGQRVDETDVSVNRALGLAVEREELNELLA